MQSCPPVEAAEFAAMTEGHLAWSTHRNVLGLKIRLRQAAADSRECKNQSATIAERKGCAGST